MIRRGDLNLETLTMVTSQLVKIFIDKIQHTGIMTIINWIKETYCIKINT